MSRHQVSEDKLTGLQKKFKIGAPYMSPNSEKVFVVEKFYEDGGILFSSTHLENRKHRFKLMPAQFKNFEWVDTTDCKSIWW